jgi:tetratricopeptide (TPR) repeat protein
VLGNSYWFLDQLELSISNAGGVFYDPSQRPSRRYWQTIAAYNQAALLEPDRAPLHYGLYVAYRAKGRYDLAVQALREFDSLTDFESDLSDQVQAQQTLLLEAQQQLQSHVETQFKQIDTRLVSPNAVLFQVAQFAYNNGCVLRALEILEQDPNLVNEPKRPDVKLFYGLLLHEAGRVQEADDILTRLDADTELYQLPGWQTTAAWASLANGNYNRAIRLWTLSTNSLAQTQLTPLLAPLVIVGPSLFWTTFHTQAVNATLIRVNAQSAEAVFEIALSHLETGQNIRAAKAFQQILKINPATRYRPLVGFYLFQLTGKEIEILPPSQRFPMEPHQIFTPESEEPVAPKP